MDIKTKGITIFNGDTHVFIPPSPTETERGGIKAKAKTTETVEVVVGNDDKLYVPGTDATLTVENSAADAKVVGNKFTAIEENLSSIHNKDIEQDNHLDLLRSDLSKYAKITDIPEKLPNPQKLTFAGAVVAEYDGSGAVTVTIPEGSGGSGGTVRIEKLSTDTAVELEPNKLYIFPEMSELAITLAEHYDTGIASEYHFVFQSGATATTLTIPDTVKLPSNFSVDASKIYEISILEGCLCVQSWAVTA